MADTKAAKAEKAAAKKKDLPGPGTRVPTTRAAAQEATAPIAGAKVDMRRVRVRATQDGYYQHKRRREGDVFTLLPLKTVERYPEGHKFFGQVKRDPHTRLPIPRIKGWKEQFSDRWMELVDPMERETITAPNKAIAQKHDETIREKYGLGGDDGGGDEDADREPEDPDASSDGTGEEADIETL